MVAQLPPFLSQRSQLKLKSVGLFVHSPRVPVSVFPSWGVPLIDGGVVFCGAAVPAA
jgi:hypothetical protein